MHRIVDITGKELGGNWTGFNLITYRCAICHQNEGYNPNILLVKLPKEYIYSLDMYNIDSYVDEDLDDFIEHAELYITSCKECFNLIKESLGDRSIKCEGCNSPSGRLNSTCSYARHNYIHIHYVENKRNSLCRECKVLLRDEVKSWNYKPKFTFIPSPKKRKGLYLGVELELEHNNGDYEKCIHIVKDVTLEKFLYLMYDGSLTRCGRNSGIEVASHPAYLEEHKKFKWKELLEKWVKKGFISHNSGVCGVHVHANRGYLAPADEDKLMIFVNSQRKVLARFGRRYSRYALFVRISHPKYSKPENHRFLNHYSALYFTDKTVEFRFFRGTLVYPTFMAILEMVDALMRFSKVVSMKTLQKPEKSWKEFIEFIESNKDYRFITDYISKKRLKNPKSLFLEKSFDIDDGNVQVSEIRVRANKIKGGG